MIESSAEIFEMLSIARASLSRMMVADARGFQVGSRFDDTDVMTKWDPSHHQGCFRESRHNLYHYRKLNKVDKGFGPKVWND